MYTISFINIDELGLLKADWERLSKGPDMTYFQSYHWNKMICDLNKAVTSKDFECKIAVVKENGIVSLIAPLWIIYKDFSGYNKKGIYIFGKGQWSDYLNFIYDILTAELLNFFFAQIKNKFGITRIVLEQIPNMSQLYNLLTNSELKTVTTQTSCVALKLPSSVDEYNKMLSKNSRQNIRTANNRAIRDGIEFSYNFDDKNINLDEFAFYRDIRVDHKNEWYKKTFKYRAKCFIEKCLCYREYKFTPYMPFTHDKHSKFLSIKTANGHLCAAFNYGIDKAQQSIVLMAVATNPEYYKYSPGILLLYNYIMKLISESEIKTLDFTRGDEKYKFVLGGKEKFITDFEFTI